MLVYSADRVIVTGTSPNRKTTIVLLKSRIGGKQVAIPPPDVFSAVAPFYPEDRNAFTIDVSEFDDRDRSFLDLARRRIDEVLRPLYPADMAEAERALAAFLAQYFGGPPEYSAVKGHPRLRMRHAHLRIGPAERDAWYADMAGALAEVGSALPDPVAGAIMEYFAGAADWMMNT